MSEMRFYHSFPRVSESVSVTDEDLACLGICILDNILAYGLLLTPETLTIPPSEAADRKYDTVISQRRACFTLLSREELLINSIHQKRFGRFSIGLDTIKARKLGILPTIYYYKSNSKTHLIDSGISQEVLFRMAEIRRLLTSVSHIEAIADPEQYGTKDFLHQSGFTLENEPHVIAALNKLNPENAKRILTVLDTERVPTWNLLDWLEIILSLFQTADSASSENILSYYQQREWRIIQYDSQQMLCLPLDTQSLSYNPSLEQLLPLLKSARTKSDKILSLLHSNFDINACWLLLGTGGADGLSGGGIELFRDYICEIVIPEEWKETILQIEGRQKYYLDSYFEQKTEDGFVVFERVKKAS